jgi:3-deoxy-D-manno-octulosonate 8-phosphate phosphatase (KDO 8-P phosphatase)
MQRIYEKARRIRLAVFDVDGVLTDGKLHLTADGETTKVFSVRDGYGLKMLAANGIRVAIVTGRNSPAVAARARELGVDLLYQAVEDKVRTVAELRVAHGLAEHDVACMGDDVVDVPLLRRCGFAVTVPEAPLLVRRHADYVTTARGGAGAVREACEFMLYARGALSAQLAACLQ